MTEWSFLSEPYILVFVIFSPRSYIGAGHWTATWMVWYVWELLLYTIPSTVYLTIVLWNVEASKRLMLTHSAHINSLWIDIIMSSQNRWWCWTSVFEENHSWDLWKDLQASLSTVIWCVFLKRRNSGPSLKPNTPGRREQTPSQANQSPSSPSQTNSADSWCLFRESSSW